jgi:CheY-like chemotaxis protein
MPRMDGFQFLDFIQKEDGYENIPVIFITGNTDAASVLKAKQMGAKGYIAKPFDSNEVRKKIKDVLPALPLR